MAEAAVKSIEDWVGKLLLEEEKYIWPIEDKMRELRRELVWMQCFLRDGDSLQQDEVVAQWILEINEYVSEAEDIVDRFFIKIGSRRRQSGWVNSMQRWFCIGEDICAMHRIVKNIDSLVAKISNLTPRLEKYGLRTTYGIKTRHIRELVSEQAEDRMSFAHLQKKNVFGLEEDAKMLVEMLLELNSERRVVAIYGMGGLGKTTLATEVFNDARIRDHFSRVVWLYISKHCNFQKILGQLLSDLSKKSIEGLTGRRSVDLISQLREELENNKCLVILDDVWEVDVWDILSDAFPQSGASGSKILLTTRKKEVADNADSHALPKPDPLNIQLSWSLFFHTLGWSSLDVTKLSSGEIQPENVLKEFFGSNGAEVTKLGHAMLNHCNGIPLAIVVLGGILRNKETVEEWHLVQQNISSYLRRGNDRGRSYMEVLALSYSDLPYHLKPLFLHLGNFPEDHEIRVEKVCRMWVAEGLVTWPRDRVAGTESLEDIARDYLTHLIQSGMIQISSKGPKGRIKSVRMHDLMRDVCLQKAITENFLSIIDHRSCPDEPLCITSSASHERLLRMAVYLAPGVQNFLPDSSSSKAHEYVRSLLFFAGEEIDGEGSEKWIKDIFKNFPWLRVLGIEGICVKGKLSEDVKKLIHLRYLSLKGTGISELPSSIGKLSFLETLDLRVCYSGSFKFPNTLWKLERLKHLFLPETSYEVKESKILRLDTLGCLETLEHLEFGKSQIKDVQKLKKLKKLSIQDTVTDVEGMRVIAHCPALKSRNLRSCSFSVMGSVIDADRGILLNFYCLDELSIREMISSLDNILPECLVKLHLESSKLVVDPMGILGRLRHLKDLHLGFNSFGGQRMICLDGSFPQLTELVLQGLELEFWTVGKNSMIGLKKLVILNCKNLSRLPEVLPSSVHITCSPCVDGIQKYGTCVCFRGTSFSISDWEGDCVRVPEGTGSKVLSLLKNNNHVALMGTNGVSKTTLADMLYRQQETRQYYDVIAWVRCPTIWNETAPAHFALKILRQIDSLTSDKEMALDIKGLCLLITAATMKKKCLIVLMDVTILSRSFLTNLGLVHGGKILLCTHEYSSTLHHGDHELPKHTLSPLSEADSLDLFRKRLGDTALMGKEETKIVEYCSGHPLAIIMLAGLLKEQQSREKWKPIQQKLALLMGMGGPENVYEICYEELTPHLQRCFLYLALFPEDAEISTMKLYRMWIAAGMVTRPDNEAEAVELLEKIAETYLKELVARGFLQVGKKDDSGARISSCWVQAPLQKFCIEKARGERFVSRTCVSQPSTSASSERLITKHLAIHFENDASRDILENALDGQGGELRTVAIFSEISRTDTGIGWDWFHKLCDSFRLLSVLDLEGMWAIEGALPTYVGVLKQLRYLSLRGTRVNEISSTVQHMSSLQTLDLRVIGPLLLPDVLFYFRNLRHLYLPDSIASRSPKLRLHKLHHLRTLENVNTEKIYLDCLPELKHLRKISVRAIHAETDLDDKLNSICIRAELSICSDILLAKRNTLSVFQNLQKVTIKGEFENPLKSGMLPGCLKELTLKHSRLQQDPIPVLEHLTGLTLLCFDHNSFMGNKMTFAGQVFPALEHLIFRRLNFLREVDLTDAHHLPVPQIKDCWRLNILREAPAGGGGGGI